MSLAEGKASPGMVHGEIIAFPGTAARATQPLLSKAVSSVFKCSSVQAADITVSIQEAQLNVPGSHSSHTHTQTAVLRTIQSC